MRYEELVMDFAERTGKNLAAIEKLAAAQAQEKKKDEDNDKVFDTTQLINSCLGLIVLPREKDIQRIPSAI